MPTAGQTIHKVIADTALPYVTNSSVISTDPQYIGGQNVMTSLRQWAERRPGFSAALESTPTVFSSLQRTFFWRRWTTPGTTTPGAFFVMFSDLSGGVAKVYKMRVGVDVSAVLLFSSTSSEAFDFVVSNNTCYMANGTDMKKYDGTNFWNWGITGPAAAPSIALVGGAGNVYASRCYCYTYYNSTTGHESSPSAISACTGVFTGKQVNIGVTASADPQVNQIRIYVTTDGGSNDPTQMVELPNSPFANATTTYPDNRADDTTLVSLRNAPAFFRNDPPPASFLCTANCSSQGRIWTFKSNTTYYSGYEEISNGVPEECFPSGLDGNTYLWDNEVFAHAALVDGIAVFTPERIFKVEGDSLDTFRRYTLLEKRGARSRTAVTCVGGSVAWFDTSNTIWVSDLGEIGLDIRPDLENVSATTCGIQVFISGKIHWVVFMDGANGTLFVYDLDRSRWMPPWDIGGTSSALGTGETAVGQIQLALARNNTKALKLVSGTYNDDGNTYAASLQSNMYRLTPEANPAWKGVLDWIELKTDANVADDVQQLTDADPSIDPYTSIMAGAQLSPEITSSGNLPTMRYNSNTPTAQLLSWKVVWNAEDANFHLYQTDVGLHSVGT